MTGLRLRSLGIATVKTALVTPAVPATVWQWEVIVVLDHLKSVTRVLRYDSVFDVTDVWIGGVIHI